MSTIDTIVEAIKTLGARPMPKRIVVDSVLWQRIEAETPVSRGTLAQFFATVPILVDDRVGEERGFVEDWDGRIHKFGKWPPTRETP